MIIPYDSSAGLSQNEDIDRYFWADYVSCFQEVGREHLPQPGDGLAGEFVGACGNPRGGFWKRRSDGEREDVGIGDVLGLLCEVIYILLFYSFTGITLGSQKVSAFESLFSLLVSCWRKTFWVVWLKLWSLVMVWENFERYTNILSTIEMCNWNSHSWSFVLNPIWTSARVYSIFLSFNWYSWPVSKWQLNHIRFYRLIIQCCL